MSSIETAVETLRKAMEDHDFLDVGKGLEVILGIPQTKLRAALNVLQENGDFQVYTIRYNPVGTGKISKIKILTKKSNTWADARKAAANGYLHHLEEKK